MPQQDEWIKKCDKNYLSLEKGKNPAIYNIDEPGTLY